jgi:hypothetical protein
MVPSHPATNDRTFTHSQRRKYNMRLREIERVYLAPYGSCIPPPLSSEDLYTPVADFQTWLDSVLHL